MSPIELWIFLEAEFAVLLLVRRILISNWGRGNRPPLHSGGTVSASGTERSEFGGVQRRGDPALDRGAAGARDPSSPRSSFRAAANRLATSFQFQTFQTASKNSSLRFWYCK
jgi:hypothetical protein